MLGMRAVGSDDALPNETRLAPIGLRGVSGSVESRVSCFTDPPTPGRRKASESAGGGGSRLVGDDTASAGAPAWRYCPPQLPMGGPTQLLEVRFL